MGSHFDRMIFENRYEMNKIRRITEEQKNAVVAKLRNLLAREDCVIFSYVYGSFIESDRFRDIDIAIYVDEEKISKREAFSVEQSLDSKLENEIGFPVDVRVINFSPLGFKYNITKGRVLTSRDDELRVDFVAKTWSFYLDYKEDSQRFLLEMLS